MLLKLSRITAIFVALFIIQTFITIKAYGYSVKNQKIMVILDEIKTLQELDTAQPAVLGADTEGNNGDPRVVTLKSFFRQHNSPLYEHSEYIVKVADQYNIDFRLIPAISMQESGACRVIPDNSYNCWGWGIYGGKVTRFGSYPEAIETVTRGLKVHYIDKGFVEVEEIMKKYNPSSNGSWAFGVNTFIKVME